MEEKLVPNKKVYYIFSSIGLGISAIAISLLYTLDKLWINIFLSIICLLYTSFFIIVYLKKETHEKSNIWGILGWLSLIIVVLLFGTAIFIGGMDKPNSTPFLKILFTALDITPSIYLLVKIIPLLVHI